MARLTRSSWRPFPTRRSRRPARKSQVKPTRPSRRRPSRRSRRPRRPSVKKGEKDIFDDTDFEVDVNLSDGDSDDKTVQLEAASDFDLEDSDTGSEVFAIDEEAVDQNASTAMAPSAFAEDEEDEETTTGSIRPFPAKWAPGRRRKAASSPERAVAGDGDGARG